MTPSIERGSMHKGKGSQSINHDRQSYMQSKNKDREDAASYASGAKKEMNYS